MGSFEATNVVLSKVKNLDPENASKIMGYLLMNLEESELIRLACCPENILYNLVLRVKTHLGMALSNPSSPSPLNPITRITSFNPFSKASPRGGGIPPPINGFDFNRNPTSPSSNAWPLPSFQKNPISPKFTPLLPSHENIQGSSSTSFSPRVNGGGDCDFVDEHQLNEYFPFLNEPPNNEDLVDPRLETGIGSQNWHSSSNNGGDTHIHRRSYSASDAGFGLEGSGLGIGYKPCLYFARGFCKNGSNCKFVHGGDSIDATSGAVIGSPSKLEGMEQQHEDFMRLKAAHYQRSMASSQLAAGFSPTSYDKYIDFLMQHHNDNQRAMLHSRAAAQAAFMMGEEFLNFSRGRMERNDFLAMVSGEKPNSASRQIYLTFPAESTFKDEDVSDYFSKFGPVQDVRIPYQQKRMFGFVTFLFPETVRLILSKGNPHFICDSRVLVKPYKEKGKVPDKRPQHQQQQLERGDFSPCLSPSGFESKEPYDFHHGERMLFNPHDAFLRKKFDEQELQQLIINHQEKRLKNLQLPDFKNNPINHQRSLSVGASLSLPNHAGYSGNLTSTGSFSTASEQPHKEVGPACIDATENETIKDNTKLKDLDVSNRSVEQKLPESLFASPTKSDYLSDFTPSEVVNEAGSSSHNKLDSTQTCDVASL